VPAMRPKKEKKDSKKKRNAKQRDSACTSVREEVLIPPSTIEKRRRGKRKKKRHNREITGGKEFGEANRRKKGEGVHFAERGGNVANGGLKQNQNKIGMVSILTMRKEGVLTEKDYKPGPQGQFLLQQGRGGTEDQKKKKAKTDSVKRNWT